MVNPCFTNSPARDCKSAEGPLQADQDIRNSSNSARKPGWITVASTSGQTLVASTRRAARNLKKPSCQWVSGIPRRAYALSISVIQRRWRISWKTLGSLEVGLYRSFSSRARFGFMGGTGRRSVPSWWKAGEKNAVEGTTVTSNASTTRTTSPSPLSSPK